LAPDTYLTTLVTSTCIFAVEQREKLLFYEVKNQMLKFEIGAPKQTESINNNTKITHIINRTNILSSK
jgi:hypothetical protein